MKKVFKYLEPLWTGTDGRISLRAVGFIALLIDFISNTHQAVYKWEAGKSFEGLSLLAGIEAGFAATLLGIAALQSVSMLKIDSQAANPQPVPDVINVANAQNVGAKTTAETVNANKVQTVNSNTTNINPKIDNPDA